VTGPKRQFHTDSWFKISFTNFRSVVELNHLLLIQRINKLINT